MNLSLVYITNRYEPRVEWLLESLQKQPGAADIEVIIIAPEYSTLRRIRPGSVKCCLPKPTIWSGPHRITGADWWSAANARNTGICLATRPWIAFVDDRSVLMPGWLACVAAAMAGNYCVCGTYEKVDGLIVDNGVPTRWDARPGRDSRLEYCERYYTTISAPYSCPGEWTYGCALALPMEWALAVGGFDETCDGLSGEDYIFGLMLQNRGYPIKFDPRMRMLEDRTPDQCGPVALRRDKGTSPNDKSHALLAKLRGLKHALCPPDLAAIRRHYQAGNGWPETLAPSLDWYDNSPIAGIQ